VADLTPDRIVRLEPDAVVILDQRRLPREEIELRCASAAEVADAIRTLAIRGAPAIGVAAGYGLALAAARGEDLDAAYEALASSRPTAVNLGWARGTRPRSARGRSTRRRWSAAAGWGGTRSS
jgi:methylthioribose-1-phosphate isomerase